MSAGDCKTSTLTQENGLPEIAERVSGTPDHQSQCLSTERLPPAGALALLPCCHTPVVHVGELAPMAAGNVLAPSACAPHPASGVRRGSDDLGTAAPS